MNDNLHNLKESKQKLNKLYKLQEMCECEIEQLEEQLYNKEQKLLEIEEEINSALFKQLFFEDFNSNYQYKTLKRNTPTTELMTEFYRSKTPFLVLDVFLGGLETESFMYNIGLVICNREVNVPSLEKTILIKNAICENPPTLTEIKTSSRCFIESDQFPKRMELLMQSIQTAVKNVGEISNDNLPLNILLPRPVKIGGQTIYDTDYGYQGSQYGDTTDFFVVGVRLMKYYSPYDLEFIAKYSI